MQIEPYSEFSMVTFMDMIYGEAVDSIESRTEAIPVVASTFDIQLLGQGWFWLKGGSQLF